MRVKKLKAKSEKRDVKVKSNRIVCVKRGDVKFERISVKICDGCGGSAIIGVQI